MTSETFSEQDCAVLYLSWRLEKPLVCPSCDASVTTRDDARDGWAVSRGFTCDGCGRIGVHLVPDLAPSARSGIQPSLSRLASRS